jgi:hypothetical protein
LWFEVSLGIVCYETVSSKIARTKWVGDVAQAVEYLLRKREVLSLNPQPHQKKKKKRTHGRTKRQLHDKANID